MPTTALYHWTVAGSPIEILIDLAAVDQLRAASLKSEAEIGGILLGRFDGKYTVIQGFETVESEHKRGTAYTLSKRDEARLGSRLETIRRRRGDQAVGYFRSHLRPGMFLDEGDNQLLGSYFPDANHVALLVRPSGNGNAAGGFFFWEDGEINRKQTYLPFPMSARELESGDFPLMEPVEAASAGASEQAGIHAQADVPEGARLTESFGEAETLDLAAANPAETRRDGATLRPELRGRPVERKLEGGAGGNRRSWQLIGAIAAAAAFGGYLIGTSGSHRDRFGARAGDLTLNSGETEIPAVPAAGQGQQASHAQQAGVRAQVTPAAPGGQGAEAGAGLSGTEAGVDAAHPLNAAGAAAAPTPVASTAPARGATAAIPAVASARPRVDSAGINTANAPASAGSLRRAQENAPLENTPRPVADENAGWQHFHPSAPTSASQVAEAEIAGPDVARAPTRPAATAVSSVYLEAVEAGGVSRAISKIPLFGSFHHARGGDAFTPPQAVKSAAPTVPSDLSRELTGTLPVDLRLKVNSEGRVSSVEVISRQTAAEFVRLAGDAAYDWRFEPARMKDKAVASDVIAHFKFRPAL